MTQVSRQPSGSGRHFLLLQGPHGPFFQQLGRMLRATGAQTTRVGFNAGDRAFWWDRASYLGFVDKPAAWPGFLADLIGDRDITDIVLYGDTRPVHAAAVALARARNLTVHVFEEGYLRPFWVSYERGGSNGNSALMKMPVAQMQSVCGPGDAGVAPVADHWGDMKHHIFYGALYHWFVLFANRRYRHFKSHRSVPVMREFQLYLNRLLLMPWLWLARVAATWRIKWGGFAYHLILLQLEHDASFQAHSQFDDMGGFLRLVVDGFARGAPGHHHLVFKAHPLEDGRAPLRRDIARLAAQHGIGARVHFVRGGKLARLLDQARSAVTVNSTSAQQALWRGLPLRAFGAAVYDKPELVSHQPLAEFFANPRRPDSAAYRQYRRFLLETSQVAGGFYSARGRRQALRQLIDMMLRDLDPYQARWDASAAQTQQLARVS
ncbi:MAG: capsule biosynthesis protein [Paracoccaceae bacterium]